MRSPSDTWTLSSQKLSPEKAEKQPDIRHESQLDSTENTTSRTSPLTFLNLAVELRQIVYEYYFRRTYITIRPPHTPSMYRVKPDRTFKLSEDWLVFKRMLRKENLWSLFMVCKTVAVEARQMCLRKSTFVFKGPTQFLDAFHGGGILGFPGRLPGTDGPDYNPFVYTRQLILDMTRFRATPVWDDIIKARRDTESVFRCLRAYMVNLEKAYIMFDESSEFFYRRQCASVLVHGWLLRVLCPFKHLKVFRLTYVESASAGEPQRRKRRQQAVRTLNKIFKELPDSIEEQALRPFHSLDYHGLSTIKLELFITQELVKRYEERAKDQHQTELLRGNVEYLKKRMQLAKERERR